MKNKNGLLKIIALSTVFVLGAGLLINHNVAPTRLEAKQHIDNFDPYTYSGSYYNNINFDAEGGMDGALRLSLQSLITPQGFYTYGGQGENKLATQLQYCDEDPTNPNNMIYLYSRDSVAKNPASSWNREHVWCQSLSNGNWGTDEGGTDLLHLRPTYNNINSSRGNTPYGDTHHAVAKTDKNTGLSFGWTGNGYFEPFDSVKGDVARTVMYLYTVYQGYKNYKPLNIKSVFQDYDILLSWHTLDRPDVLEGNRNDYVQTSRQKNRNPFVDHPELAWKIFGDEATEEVKNACMEAYPANGGGNPVEPTGIKLNKSTAEVAAGKTLQLRATLEPSGATGTVNWTSSNTSVATVSNSGLITAKTAGTATITASVNSFSDTCEITVIEAINNYGTLENPLTITDAKELLDKTGANETEEVMYVKGIVSSNNAYDSTKGYNALWLKSDDGSVDKAFELYKAKAPSSITSVYSAENSLVGLEIIACGYGKIYNSNTYELCTSSRSPYNPEIQKISAPEVTSVTLDKENAEIEIGETVTLIPTVTPSNANPNYVWSSSDENIATVNNGVVTGVGVGIATITVEAGDDITAECIVKVTRGGGTIVSYGLVASYDFSTGNSSSNGEYTNSNDLLGRFANSAKAGEGLSDIVTGVSGNSKVYAGYQGYYNFGLKLGASKGNGTFTLSLDKEVTRIVVKASSWDTTDSLKVGDASAQVPGVAFNKENPIKTLTFEIIPSDVVEFVFNKRGFIQSIDFYTEVEPVETPEDYLTNASSYSTIYGTENKAVDGCEETVVFANLGFENAQVVTEVTVGNITITASKASGSNDPAYYTTGKGLRLYKQNTLTIESTINITDIEFTLGSGTENGIGVLGPSTGEFNDNVWSGNTKSVTFDCNQPSKNIRIAALKITCGEVTYSVDKPYLRFGGSIPKADWEAIEEKWDIEDYGVMLLKEDTLNNTYKKESIKQAYNDGCATTISHKGSGATPASKDDNYVFAVKINMTNTDYRDVKYVAAPFIVVDGTYYFLKEMRKTFNEVVNDCLKNNNSDLSLEALSTLKPIA